MATSLLWHGLPTMPPARAQPCRHSPKCTHATLSHSSPRRQIFEDSWGVGSRGRESLARVSQPSETIAFAKDSRPPDAAYRARPEAPKVRGRRLWQWTTSSQFHLRGSGVIGGRANACGEVGDANDSRPRCFVVSRRIQWRIGIAAKETERWTP